MEIDICLPLPRPRLPLPSPTFPPPSFFVSILSFYFCWVFPTYLADATSGKQDPGYGVLKRLIGERLAKVSFLTNQIRCAFMFPPISNAAPYLHDPQDLVRNFLFNGIDELGSKGFLDYFPQYRCEDGTINEKRSIVGRSFETRPWDARGEFIGNSIEIQSVILSQSLSFYSKSLCFAKFSKFSEVSVVFPTKIQTLFSIIFCA